LRLSQSQLTWLDFTKALPFEFTQLTEWKSWAAFFCDLLVWAGSVGFAFFLYGKPVWQWFDYLFIVVSILGVFFSYANLFVLGHECGHFIFSKYKWANKMVGHFILSIFHIGFHNWKISHNFHHTYSQCINKDTTWTKDKMTMSQYLASQNKIQQDYKIAYGTPVGILVGFYVACFKYFLFAKYHSFISLSTQQKQQLAFSSFLVFVIGFGHLSLFYWLGGASFYFLFHLLPLMIGAIFAVGFPLLQHAHEKAVYFDEKSWTPLRGQILGTYNFRMPYIFERLFNDVNFHTVHHISTKIPWYHLRKAHQGLKEKYPDYIFEYDLNAHAMKKIFQNPIAEWDPEYNLYKSVPIPNHSQHRQ
jgi:acyl-lipid omega-6 desaturase (Delta-12 desaturase)